MPKTTLYEKNRNLNKFTQSGGSFTVQTSIWRFSTENTRIILVNNSYFNLERKYPFLPGIVGTVGNICSALFKTFC